MIVDKVIILNDSEAVLVCTDRLPIKLYAKDDIRNFVPWFLSPKVVIRLDEYRKSIALSSLDTSEIKLEVA